MRQLENICHWLTVMAPAQLIEAKDLPPELQPRAPARRGRRRAQRGRRRRVGEPRRSAPAAGARRPRLPPHVPPPPARRQPRGADRGWLAGLEREARELLQAGEPMVWDTLTRKFEAQLIHTALEITRGRRIEAAQKLGIGRNTITRKIQELGLDDK